MVDVITSISKYILVGLILLYTLGGFYALRYRKVSDMHGCYCLLNVLIFSFHAVAFVVIAANIRNYEMIVFYLIQVAFFVIYILLFCKLYPRANRILLNHMMFFLMLGFVILTRLDYDRAVRQFELAVAAALISLIVPRMFAKLKAARLWAEMTGFVGILLLAVVLVMERTNGANLSLSIAGIQLQPSEFVKISFVLLLAVMLRERTDWKRLLFVSGIAAMHVGILVLSTDLGGALLYAFAFLFILYTATKKVRYLVGGIGIGSVAAVVAYHLFSHVQTRVQAWLDPWPIFQGKGSQVGNSLFGIATGGWFGQGLYRGQPNFIPVVEKDFVFSAICEEMGGLVGICVILICMACLLMFLSVSVNLYLKFYKLTGVGLATIYGIQVLLTIGGNIKFIPSTGVTLPLVSYGGSSLFSTFILFGIMQELYIKRQTQIEELEERQDSWEDEDETVAFLEDEELPPDLEEADEDETEEERNEAIEKEIEAGLAREIKKQIRKK